MNNPQVMREGTFAEYHLNCLIVVKDVSFEDYQSTGRFMNSRKMVFLIPQDSDQSFSFLATWLPDESVEEDPAKRAAGHLYHHNEVVAKFGHPFNTLIRGAVMRGNDRCAKPHIFIMSYGVSKLIIEQPSLWNKIVPLTVLPEDSDELADIANKGDDLLPFEKKSFASQEDTSSGTG